jgi:hypothetical protein
MKNSFYFLVGILITLSACSKLDELLTFTITNQADIVLPAQTGINIPFVVNTPSISTSSESAFRNNNTRADLVKNVNLQSLSLNITSPAGQTFQPLRDIEIYILAEGLPATLMAYKYDIPQDIGSTLQLDTTQENLDDYIKKSSYSIRTDVVTRQFFSQDITIRSTMTFSVTANVIK